jgi:hypothetical protein
MTLQEWGAAVGTAFGTAGLVLAGGKQWFAKRTEKKIDAVSVELGVGVEGPSLLSLVASTNTSVATMAASVGRLETNSEESRKGAADVLAVLKRHGEKLEDQSRRIGDQHRRIAIIEDRHNTCGFTSERVAELLALKTEDVARLLSVETKATAAKLAEKTEKTAEDLARKEAS